MNVEEKARLLGLYEIGWWKAHHRKDIQSAKENMIREYKLQYGTDEERASRAVELRVKAALLHDEAETYEDVGNKAKAENYWYKAESCLVEHFKILLGE